VTTAPRLWPFIAIAAAAILAVHVGVYVRDGLHADRMFQDTDGYMWLNRVTHLHETGDWFDHSYPRIDPPAGHAQHWTRPFDAVLLGGGALLGSVVGFERGLYYWALAVTPLLHVLALGALLWAARPLVRRRLLPRAWIPALLLVFVAQVGAYQPFLMGRPDHHAPLALLFLLYLGFLLRLLLDRRDATRAAVGLGLVAALAVWILVEALVFVVLGMAALGLSWLLGNDRLARPNAIHAAALFAGVLAAWLLEWGPGALAVREVDVLSAAHVVLFGLTALFWALLWWATRAWEVERPAARAAVAAVGAAAVLGGTALLFPAFLGSPFGDVDPLLGETWLFNIDELQPLLASVGDARNAAGRLVLLAGIAIAALPYTLARAARTGDREERIAWLLFATALAAYLALSFHQRRWTDYLALTAVLPYGLLAAAVLDRLGRRWSGGALAVGRPAALAGLVFGPILLAVVLGTGSTDGPRPAGPVAVPSPWRAPAAEVRVAAPVAARSPARRTCDLARIAQVLEDPAWFPRPALVLAHADHGPELLYRTRHGVLSITNHRHQPGYVFTWDTLTETDPRRAAAALHRRGVGALVLCASDLITGFFPVRAVDGSFLEYLAGGGVPDGYALHAATPYWRVYRRDAATDTLAP
jgi:asparagine N-glycosylation enzyme membrane subunit Stt3